MRCHERILDPQGVLVRGKDTRNCLSAREDKVVGSCLEARKGPLTRSGPPAPWSRRSAPEYQERKCVQPQSLSAALQALQFIITQL